MQKKLSFHQNLLKLKQLQLYLSQIHKLYKHYYSQLLKNISHIFQVEEFYELFNSFNLHIFNISKKIDILIIINREHISIYHLDYKLHIFTNLYKYLFYKGRLNFLNFLLPFQLILLPTFCERANSFHFYNIQIIKNSNISIRDHHEHTYIFLSYITHVLSNKYIGLF